MHSSTRLGSLAAVLVATTVTAPALGSPAGDVTGPTVSVHGRLLVVPAESPGGHARYGVEVAGGAIVQVRGQFSAHVRTGDRFVGRLALPAEMVSRMADRNDPRVADVSRLAARRSLTLAVVGAPSVTAAPASTGAGTTHAQYVAAISNKGDLTQGDTALLGHVTTVGAYWETQSNGAIADIGVPSTVTHFASTKATADCGLGSDFFPVVNEAAQQFPGFSVGDGDQLVLFVPPGCSSGGVVGEGTIGSSFASGGLLIVKAGASIESTYGHETGHNYGFEHANARYGDDSMEYYGAYDVMGFAIEGFDQLTALSTPYRVYQGITDPGEIQDVDLGDGATPVHVFATIAPRTAGAGVRSVRVTDPDTGEALYLDYRAGTDEDAGSLYTAGGQLLSGHGLVGYGPGVTIDAARDEDGMAGSGVDTLVVDADGDTSLGAGDSWSDSSGLLTVTVTSLSASEAHLEVDFAPPQDFEAVGTPVIGGSAQVGERVTLDAGSWTPVPTSLQVRWTADGQPVPALDDDMRFVVGPELLGKTLVATVTARKPGYRPTTTASAGVVVAKGSLSTSRPKITGTPAVGETLRARPGAWTSGTTFSYAWYADGNRIKHQSAKTLTLTKAQRGTRIRVKVTGTKPAYTSVSRKSARTAKVT